MEGGGLGDLFGDPEELQRRLAEFAEQMQGQQRLAWADNAIKLAVDMTVAAVQRVNLQGNAEAQAEQIRTVMAQGLSRGRHTRARGARGPAVAALRPASRLDSREARPACDHFPNERKRKMNTTAPSPTSAVNAAIAIC